MKVGCEMRNAFLPSVICSFETKCCSNDKVTKIEQINNRRQEEEGKKNCVNHFQFREQFVVEKEGREGERGNFIS
jgi:hypothetical protein